MRFNKLGARSKVLTSTNTNAKLQGWSLLEPILSVILQHVFRVAHEMMLLRDASLNPCPASRCFLQDFVNVFEHVSARQSAHKETQSESNMR